jgi:hypothetical protein
MGLLIWLRAFFQAKTLGHTSHPLAGLCLPFWVHWMVPKCPKTAQKLIFWLFWTISPTRMGLLIWLGAYFQTKILGRTSCPLAGLCVPFWVYLGFANAPKQHEKNPILWLFWTISHTRMGQMIWLGPYFQAKTLGHTSSQLADFCLPFRVHWGVPKYPKTA